MISYSCPHGSGVICEWCTPDDVRRLASPALTAALTAWRDMPSHLRASAIDLLEQEACRSTAVAEDERAQGLDGEDWDDEARACLAALELLREAGR